MFHQELAHRESQLCHCTWDQHIIIYNWVNVNGTPKSYFIRISCTSQFQIVPFLKISTHSSSNDLTHMINMFHIYEMLSRQGRGSKPGLVKAEIRFRSNPQLKSRYKLETNVQFIFVSSSDLKGATSFYKILMLANIFPIFWERLPMKTLCIWYSCINR